MISGPKLAKGPGMSTRSVTFALVAALAGVAGYALLHDSFHATGTLAESTAATSPATESDPGADQAFPDLPSDHPAAASGHDHASSASTLTAAELTAPDEAPAITWTAPKAWTTAPNPNAMRIATYKIAHAKTDAADADLSVVRAGGTADDNIDRWREQFEASGEVTRTVKTVRGLKVTVVEIHGTYLGGSGSEATRMPGWTLVGAIVEAPRMPYFFKLTGATATVTGARAAFDSLVESITPSPSPTPSQ
jgi:hypothetical protein